MPAGIDDPRDSRDRRSSRDRSSERSSDRRRRHSSRSRSRSRSPRDRSRSRDRSRERRRKKKSGWDQAPPEVQAGLMPGMIPYPHLPDPAASVPPSVSGSIHPSRMPQLGNLQGAIPASSGVAMPFNPLAMMQQQMPGAMPGIIPPHLAALMSGGVGGLPLGIGGGSSGISQTPAVSTANLPGTRQARRLYVGGIPIPMTENELKAFFSDAMRQAFPDLPQGESVVSVYLNLDKKFAFVELVSPEQATTGMGLDGIVMRGQTLRIKRPSDYNPQIHGVAQSASRITPQPQAGSASGSASTGISNQVPDGPNKIFAGGIPYSLSDEEVKELLGSFGQLRAFHLVKERESNTSKGYCFFEYLDPNLTDTAVMGLNNLKIGDKTLTVRRAQPKADHQPGMGVGMPQAYGAMQGGFGGLDAGLTPAQLGALAALRAQGGMPPHQMAAPIPSGPPRSAPTRVLVLLQMVVADILRDDQEYREIFEDIETECRRYGEVRNVVIPRPHPSGAPVNGLGKVFVEFGHAEQAMKARAEVEGRQFDGRTVAADFWNEDKFARRELE